MTIHIDYNLIILLLIAAMNAYTAYKTNKTEKNMAIVEKATNSMKDALVASTAKASLAEGHAAGLEQGRTEVGDANEEAFRNMK